MLPWGPRPHELNFSKQARQVLVVPVKLPPAFSPPGTAAPARAAGRGEERPAWIGVVDRIGDVWIVGVLGLMVLVFGLLNTQLFTKDAWLSISNYSVQFLLLDAKCRCRFVHQDDLGPPRDCPTDSDGLALAT